MTRIPDSGELTGFDLQLAAASSSVSQVHPTHPTAAVSEAVAPVFWLTGLSGAGKSTLAEGARRHLLAAGTPCIVIDGDVLRAGLSTDLSFTAEDRAENVRRAAEVAAICANSGIVTFVSLVSPFEVDRRRAREILGGKFHEIFVDASFPVCRERDVKGLYKRAAEGKVLNFTGIDSPYERPTAADLAIDTAGNDVETCLGVLMGYVRGNGGNLV
jgi:adenylyl-sulfate kinase